MVYHTVCDQSYWLRADLGSKVSNFSMAWKILKSNHPLGSCPPTKARLGLSKKVLKDTVAQRPSKLQYLKVFGGIFLYIKVEQKF